MIKADYTVPVTLDYMVYDAETGIIMLGSAPIMYQNMKATTSWNTLGTDNSQITSLSIGSSVYYWYMVGERVSDGWKLPEGFILIPVLAPEGDVAEYNIYRVASYHTTKYGYISIIANTTWITIGESGTLAANHTLSGWTGQTTDIPEDISITANEVLTASGEEANQIKNTVDTAVSDYQSGTITLDDLQTTIKDKSTQLDSLQGNTIPDLIAINNAQNSIEIAQNTVTQEILNNTLYNGAGLNSELYRLKKEADSISDKYRKGTLPQDTANEQLQVILSKINELSNSTEQSIANRLAITESLTYVQNIQQSIYSNSDLDESVSSEAQTENEEEKEYIQDLITNHGEDVSTLDDGIDRNSASEIQSILSYFWELTFIKDVLPVVAILMVISVALGVRYKL